MRPCLIALLLAVMLTPPAVSAKEKAKEPWFRREKVRCISYLDASEEGVGFVPKARAMGFNCALAMLAGAPPERLMPLIKAADKAGLRLVLVDYFDASKYLAQEPGRRFVAADGRAAPHLACPTDEKYWESVVGQRALELAELRRAGHPSVCGLLFDIEDYAGRGDLPCGSLWLCYCDQCFGAFMRSVGKGEQTVAASERQSWLSENELLENYLKFQDNSVATILSNIRKQIDEVAPDFMLAIYPWVYVEPAERKSRIAWDIRFVRGLGTERVPFLLLDERTYVWGYDPAMERQRADLKSQGLNFLAVTGFNVVPAERVWWPEEMAPSAYWASRRSDGYWIYVGDWPLLRAAPGEVYGIFGDRPEAWVKQFTAVNAALASGKAVEAPPLPLPPIERCFQLTDLYGPKHSPGTKMFVRRWTEIGLPWQGGELVLLGARKGDWLSFQRPVRRPDCYEISAWLTAGPDRPVVRLYVDDKPVDAGLWGQAGEAIDLYQSITTPGERVVLGYADLGSGDHTFRLVAEGKPARPGPEAGPGIGPARPGNERSKGYGIGLRAIRMERVGHPPESWWVVGPFDNTGEDRPGYDAVYPPEREIKLGAAYPGKGGQPVRWQRAAATRDGYLDLVPLFSEKKDAAAYCLTYAYSPSEGPRTVILGCDDGGKLFVNGQLVWGENVARSAERQQNQPTAQLRRGWNEILFKVTQTGGAWGIYFRFYDPKREMRYSTAPGGD